MKKQYTVENAYEDNVKVTFYVDGNYESYKILSDWKLDGYLQAKQEDGWQKAYSNKEMEKAIDEIASLEESLSWWKKQLEEIKNNLIGE